MRRGKGRGCCKERLATAGFRSIGRPERPGEGRFAAESGYSAPERRISGQIMYRVRRPESVPRQARPAGPDPKGSRGLHVE